MRRFPDSLLLAGVLALAACAPAPVVHRQDRHTDDAGLSLPQADLDRALNCPKAFSAIHDPVLLIHGSGTTGKTWNSGYVRALGALRYDVCTVTLPDYAWGDIRQSSEYVVNAVRSMSARSARHVAMIGHSQASLEMRWALEEWPDVRTKVSAFISLSGVNHGAPMAIKGCASGNCPAAAWQMMPASALLAHLNRGEETAGNLPYTNLYSATDTVSVPPTSEMRGATNIEVQAICPGRKVTHAGMIYDAAAFALVLDGLSHASAPDTRRIDPAVCKKSYLPGLTASEVEYEESAGLVRSLLSYYLAGHEKHEPAIALEQ